MKQLNSIKMNLFKLDNGTRNNNEKIGIKKYFNGKGTPLPGFMCYTIHIFQRITSFKTESFVIFNSQHKSIPK